MAKVLTVYPSACKPNPNSAECHMFLETLCSSVRDTGKCECCVCQYVLTNASAVQFPCIETCGMRRWKKPKEKGGAGCEDRTCFMARDVSEKYQSQIHRSLEHLEISVACNISDQCFCTDTSHKVI